MNAPANLRAALVASQHKWAGHAPSKWHWQVLVFRPDGDEMTFQRSFEGCSEGRAIRWGNDMAETLHSDEFAVRGPDGKVVYFGERMPPPIRDLPGKYPFSEGATHNV